MKGRILQYVAAFCASLIIACTFMCLLWATSVNLILDSDTSPLGPITLLQKSLNSFLLMAGAIIGNVLLGFMIERFGRRGTLLLSAIPCFIGWIIILFVFDITAVLVARFIMGISLTAPIAICMFYIGEICEADIRGRLAIFCLLSAEMGAVLSLVLGSISYEIVALMGAVLPAVFFALFYFMPESPYFYLSKGRNEEAEKNLLKLRNTDDVSEELNEMKKALEANKLNSGGWKSLFLNPKYRRNLLIVLVLKSMQDLSGNIAIQNYMGAIFQAANTGWDINMSNLICMVVPFPFMFICSYLVERFGRKPLFFISALGTAIAMFLESVYFYLRQNDADVSSLSWMPVTGIFLTVIFKACGIGPIPYLVMAEFFPNNIKGVATSITMIFGSVLGAIVVLIFPLFSAQFGLATSFLFFSICCIFGFFFGVFFVPETKGVSLTKID